MPKDIPGLERLAKSVNSHSLTAASESQHFSFELRANRDSSDFLWLCWGAVQNIADLIAEYT